MKKLALISVCVLGLAIAGSAMNQVPAKKETPKKEAAAPKKVAVASKKKAPVKKETTKTVAPAKKETPVKK